jgi:2-polyprenyl-3-methyl-5-hydroxy-6-metoxy-1,4-benzoquinol methylase
VIGGTTFWRCPTCDLFQYGNLVDAVAYEGEYHRGYSLRIRRKQASAASRLSRVAAAVTGDAPRLLDVGCSVGATLLAARQRGWDAVGVDVSRDAIRFCRGYGLRCQTVDNFDLPFPDQSFDVVTAWHVIEHVEDVRETLSEWRRVLRPGGLLAMETPDASSPLVRRRGTKYRRFWAPEHTYTFSPDNLGRFVEDADLELVTVPGWRRDTGSSLWNGCYSAGRESLLWVQRLLGRHKAFLMFARRPNRATEAAASKAA